MKRWISIMLAGLLLLLAACSGTDGESGGEAQGGQAGEQVNIGISQLVEHPSLDQAREGFVAALEDAGYKEGENLAIDYQNAQGDVNNNMTIAQKLVNDDNDLILGIATSSVQAITQTTQDIPVLFTAITDPVKAGLVESMENPGGNVTGTSDTHPDAIKNTIASIKEFFPEAKTVGIVYNSGEENAVVNVESAKKAIEENGLTSVEATVSSSSEVKQATESLVGRMDVLYVPKDNTVVSALESVLTVANEQKIPAFVGEGDSVERGGFASYGLNYHDLGYSTGEMAVEVLKGKAPSEISVGIPENLELMVNKQTAELLGVQFTEEQQRKITFVE
ncbi:ABC transporter substrate-binding protein [Bacillus thermotolerans]|uniref:ABC transporter substrate-binding protein n=1 Tax=Bacillus thermotolerans TaxID=1221996 RepID=UPI000589243A|nr:ABC transporter substrate-binding protein [Bacillus thermotolerans]